MDKRTIFPAFLHGGDYNPDQWLDYPEILEKDIELMKKAHVNTVSLGIFAWAALEPREGEYTFDWLEKIIDNLYQHEIYTILATPSGAKPRWMSEAHPEIRRVAEDGHRDLSGYRHNHCYTSPYYREKVRQMNTKLAERFSSHPGVIAWHISNEYGGECHCELCQAAFRDWLKEKYGSLEALNHAWWSHFWSHTYTDYEQIHSPVPNGETATQGLKLDWKRFVTDRTVDFMKAEIAAVRAVNPDIPVTINMMGWYDGLNYYKFGPHIDLVSWDSYPMWHTTKDDLDVASNAAAAHDIMRSIKRAPWLLMESVPSAAQWTPTSTLKRPGMHMTSSIQAVAHGSDSVQYFQWRKGRGSGEKFHGAIVDHYGGSDTRVFRDVAEVGIRLEALTPILHTEVRPEVAVVYDVENRWAVENSEGPRNKGIKYIDDVEAWHRAFWEQGVPIDMIDMETDDLERYKVICCPMLYMYRAGFEKKLRAFVEQGGTIIGTYHTGIVNDTDLCYLGGWPGETMDLFGVWNEEIDSLTDEMHNRLIMTDGSDLNYEIHDLCAIIHAKGAKVLAEYGEDFYKGTPALTVNEYGKGKAYYVAARTEGKFIMDFCTKLVCDHGIERSLDAKLPHGVVPMMRKGEDGTSIVFVQNFEPYEQTVQLDHIHTVVETGESVETLKIPAYGTIILKK